MNIDEYMEKHDLNDEILDKKAAPYEKGNYAHEDTPVYSGSHLDAVGKKRVTVVYDAKNVQRVSKIARERGMKPSEIYRDALDYYLAAQTQ